MWQAMRALCMHNNTTDVQCCALHQPSNISIPVSEAMYSQNLSKTTAMMLEISGLQLSFDWIGI